MSNKQQNTCEWLPEFHEKRLPTPLVNLNVQGLNTPLVESLSSYLSRCADHIDLTVKDVLCHVISPLLSHQYLTPARVTESSFSAIAAMNGRCGTSAEWVRVLGMLSHCQDLIHTNFLMFRNIIPDKKLLNRDRSWCPVCLNELREQNRVYEPLLFNVAEVKACPRHGCWLVDRCPCCQSKSPVLAPRIVPGYCTSCGEWLGAGNAPQVSPSEESYLRVANLVGDLLAVGPTLREQPKRERIADFIAFLIRTRMKDKSARALARLLKINHSYVLDWLNGAYVPMLGNLLWICQVFNVTLVEIANGDFFEESTAYEPACETSTGLNVTSQSPIDWPMIHQTMQRIASGEEPPRKVIDIARSCNCHVSALYQFDSRLCKAVTRRYKDQEHQRQAQEEEIFVAQIRQYLRECQSLEMLPIKNEIYKRFGGRSKKRQEIVERVFEEEGL
ncbi:helix-turn-helix transcriptional regulator [Geobacter pelophilus]|uniref:Helix-turn-helix transcriptional regulator n=1 Tax=Geoanaerobacter pelophilus TaxID=60036 RepID=A0AAW4KYL9_9BACT|nr:TniQ family protein [Geoanaerobacter pelophilus]MBT0663658.1 helix-turn-helix transcriptional regulator [Geoanaerobacter pelophilus]